jgi:hypothetical protein
MRSDYIPLQHEGGRDEQREQEYFFFLKRLAYKKETKFTKTYTSGINEICQNLYIRDKKFTRMCKRRAPFPAAIPRDPWTTIPCE